MTEEDNKAFWPALFKVLQQLEASLPYGEEPKIIAAYYDEEWKEDAQREQHEEDFSYDTDIYITKMCEKHQWPKRSKSPVRFYAEKRAKWGINYLRILLTPDEETEGCILPRPECSGFDFIKWLLVDAYSNRYPPPPKPTMKFFDPITAQMNLNRSNNGN